MSAPACISVVAVVVSLGFVFLPTDALIGRFAGLANTGIAALGGSTLRDYFVGVASGVGLDVSNAKQDVDAQQTLVDRTDQARTSVSGVNVDEEMVSLISEQQAYQAAAKLVTVADQMMTDLMNVMTT